MANVRKVKHPSGETAWRATIKTLDGKRKSKNFPRKGDADAWAKKNDGAGATGSADMTVKGLALDHNRWFDGLVKSGERSQRTLDGYDSHLKVHVAFDPIAALTLANLSAPDVQQCLDRLVASASAETARRVKTTLSAWFEHGQRNGWLTNNPAEAAKVVAKRRRKGGSKVEIPPKADLQALLRAAPEGERGERDAAVVYLLMFGGLRISEMLGAADSALDLRRPSQDGSGGGGLIGIRERLCSRHVTLGETKSEDGERDVPLGPSTAAALRAWRVARGPVAAETVMGERVTGRLFPPPPGLRHGPFWSYSDFRRLCWNPMLIRAGLGGIVEKGRFKRQAVDFGPHTLRHVYASIQIESGVTPKRLQKLMGHATLAMTMDLYGHLWTDAEGDQAMAEASERVITHAPRP
jgi:integrase